MTRSLVLAKSISLILAALMLWHYGRVGLYAQTLTTQSQREARSGQTAFKGIEENRFDALLDELKEVIRDDGARTKAAPEKGFAGVERVNTIKDKLAAEDEKNQQYFAQVGRTIADKKLPAEIRERHAGFVREYQAKYDALMAHLDGLQSAHKTATGLWGKLTGQSQSVNWDLVIEKATAFLNSNTPQPRPRQNFDPHNLPHRSLKAEQPIAPKLTREEWLQAFPKEAATSGSGSNPSSVQSTVAKTRDTNSPLATSPPTAADLAETIEVKFTPEIRQLADSLDRNPVKIYNWVRNNIEFVPTWGSIQGAQLCLETKSCNAFDTASMLIALLRVSGIPARYQMGTIEVPIEKFKNWAGGFTNAEAAAALFASGGVPSVVRRVNQSGQVISVKLEHVWVKTFVDYTPSGGAINIQGDTWVDLDGGFKQYAITTALQDLTVVVPFNRDAYLSSPTSESPTSFYHQTLSTYVSQNFPGRTLSDFITRRTIRGTPMVVLGGLPYRALIRGVNFAELPQTLRQQITIKVERAGVAGSQTAYTTNLPDILSKRLTLSFKPATASDVQTATSFEGLYLTPPYLMSVKPVLRLNSQVVATGPPLGMGQTLQMTFLLDLPGLGRRTVQNTVTAATYLTILFAPHLNSEVIGNNLAREFRQADDRFGTLNIDNSDRDPSVGGMLQVLSSYFFNRLDASTDTLEGLFPIVQLKTAFVAYVSSDVEGSSLFGVPAALQFTGISIDADLLEDVALARDGTANPSLTFEKLRGLESSYWEHGIFEPEGTNPSQPAVSTVRALQHARREGISIHEINAANLAVISQLRVSPDTKEAMLDAVNAGLVVTTPASDLQLGRWRGVGYIVEDPLTGAGAYRISGGSSGGAIPIELLQPHLVGGRLPPTLRRWPTAIVAVGWPVGRGALKKMIARMYVNKWRVSESIGAELRSAGYNVYTADVDADNFVSFVQGTGDLTTEDVFCYIGPSSLRGDLALDNVEGQITTFSTVGRKFSIAFLAAKTGAECLFEIEDGGPLNCSENVQLQQFWTQHLIFCNRGSDGSCDFGGAHLGIRAPISLEGSKIIADFFWRGMAVGLNAEQAATGLGVYMWPQPAPRATLRGFGR